VSTASNVVTIRVTDGLVGTITTAAPGTGTLTAAVTDADIGTFLRLTNYFRTSLWYHTNDAQYLDAAIASRCLSFDLDVRKGTWAYKRVNGIAGSTLTGAQANALRAANANYVADALSSAGTTITAFSSPGWVSGGDSGAGRSIDVMTTLDWFNARLEEELINVLLQETHMVGYDDAGIARFDGAVQRVVDRGLRAGHFVPFKIQEGQAKAGLQTPHQDFPTLAETSTTERANRTLTATGLAYLRAGIEVVNYSAEIRE
jgi:hypothetical protein